MTQTGRAFVLLQYMWKSIHFPPIIYYQWLSIPENYVSKIIQWHLTHNKKLNNILADLFLTIGEQNQSISFTLCIVSQEWLL